MERRFKSGLSCAYVLLVLMGMSVIFVWPAFLILFSEEPPTFWQSSKVIQIYGELGNQAGDFTCSEIAVQRTDFVQGRYADSRSTIVTGDNGMYIAYGFYNIESGKYILTNSWSDVVIVAKVSECPSPEEIAPQPPKFLKNILTVIGGVAGILLVSFLIGVAAGDFADE